MNIFVNIKIALSQMMLRPFKSFLVLLATILGSAVAIFAPSVVNGASQNAEDRRREFGSDRISIFATENTGELSKLDDAGLLEIRENLVSTNPDASDDEIEKKPISIIEAVRLDPQSLVASVTEDKRGQEVPPAAEGDAGAPDGGEDAATEGDNAPRRGPRTRTNEPPRIPGLSTSDLQNCTVLGCEPDLPEARGFYVDKELGRYFTDEEVARKAAVCVIEPELAESLFGKKEDALGKTILVHFRPEPRVAQREIRFGRDTVTSEVFTIVGVMEMRSDDALGTDDRGFVTASGDREVRSETANYLKQMVMLVGGAGIKPDDWKRDNHTIHVPITWFADHENYYDWFFTKVHRLNHLGLAVKHIKLLLNARGVASSIQYNASVAFIVQQQGGRDLLAEYKSLTTALYIICLTLGAIVIVCVLLASIMERYQEIGIRRVEGARRIDILVQFFTEAVVYSTVGALLGIPAAIPLCEIAFYIEPSNMVRYSISWPHVVQTVIIVIGFGIVAGIYPAFRASRIDPIQALRYE
ncbi:MAG: ABC transporter permease [Planctomycetes bacterium]|nr:ABC transporter permease [Planctomycetota bacterium]